MKKFLRTFLCGAVLALSMSTAAFAAEGDLLISPAPSALPERQGDFYVMVNGEFVTFPDAAPQGRDNRSFLPMAATFSQLGFAEEDMTWNPDGQITASKDDLTIALNIGKNEIVVTQGEESKTIPTDVAPYVDPATWRTYVPFGLVADALGYNVGWDGMTKTVIIDDVDAIWAANTETYELMDKYLAYSEEVAGEKTRMSGDYSVNMYTCNWNAESTDEFSFLMSGAYDSYAKQPSAFQFETDMAWSMNLYSNGEDITQTVLESGELPAIPKTIDFDMRGDLLEGTMYFQSAALCELLEQPDMANAWYKLDMDAMLEGSGLSWSELMGGILQQVEDMKTADLIQFALRSSAPSSIYMTTSDTLAMLNAMLGDSAFVKDGNAYYNELSVLGIPMSLSMTTNASGSKVTGCAVDLYLSDPLFGEILMSVTMEGKEMAMYMAMDTSASVDLEAAEGTFVVFEMLMDGTYQSTNKSPAVEPPAGAVIVDLMELLEDELAATVAETVPAPAP